MPFSGSVYSRLYNWVNDRDSSINISATRTDAEMDGFVSAINQILAGSIPFTGAVKGSSGSVTAPAWSFSADTNTGIYRIAENNLGIATDGVNRLDVSNAAVASTVPIQVDTINEQTTSSGVTIDGVLLKDNDVTATDATLSGNLSTATATITSDLNTDDITERTSGHGVEIDGVLLKDGNITVGTSGKISSNDTFTIDIDVDNNSSSNWFRVADNGLTRLEVTDNGQSLMRLDDGGEVLQLIDDTASSASDALSSLAFRYSTTAGGSSTRIGYVGFVSNSNGDMDIKNDITNGNIDLFTVGTGVVRINGNTIFDDGNITTAPFLRSDTNDVMSGLLDLSRGFDEQMRVGYNTGSQKIPYIGIYDGETTARGRVQGLSSGIRIVSTAGAQLDLETSNVVKINGNTVFHGGNDGSGSGLDADLLDGQEGSYYRNASNLSSGTLPDARLSSTVDSRLAAAWVSFNGTGTPSINSDYNVSSITDNGVGDYTINFSSSMPNTNYTVIATCNDLGSSVIYHTTVTVKNTGNVRVVCSGFDGNVFVAIDPDDINVVIYST